MVDSSISPVLTVCAHSARGTACATTSCAVAMIEMKRAVARITVGVVWTVG